MTYPHKKQKEFMQEALWDSLPVLFAYFPLAMTWGLLWEQAGLPLLWAFLYSACVYAGTVQFLAVAYLSTPEDPFSFALTTLGIALRTGVYTCSLWNFLPSSTGVRILCSYLMVDGTYATLLTKKSETLRKSEYTVTVSLLIYLYWIIGSMMGAYLGSYIPNSITDLQFALPCLIAILLMQQAARASRIYPALLALGCALPLILLGIKNWFLPALTLTLALCYLLQERKPKIEKEG